MGLLENLERSKVLNILWERICSDVCVLGVPNVWKADDKRITRRHLSVHSKISNVQKNYIYILRPVRKECIGRR